MGELVGLVGKLIGVMETALRLLRGRKALAIMVRYIPEASSYIIEVRSQHATTIVGAGLGEFPEDLYNLGPGRVWHVEEALPHRLQERDCNYFTVWWGNDVPERQKATYVRVRDAEGKTYKLPLTTIVQTSDNNTVSNEKRELTTEAKARLFNMAVERENVMMVKDRLTHLEAEVELYKTVARYEEEKRRKQQNTAKYCEETAPYFPLYRYCSHRFTFLIHFSSLLRDSHHSS
jgi:hypothetical protein